MPQAIISCVMSCDSHVISPRHLVEALALQAAPSDGEVDEGHPRAEVGGELNLEGEEESGI